MIKLAVFGTLVLGSILANVNGNHEIQQASEDTAASSNFNDLHQCGCGRKRRLTVNFFRTGCFTHFMGSMKIRPNKCYAYANFRSVRLSGNFGRNPVIMVCTQADCTGKCRVVHKHSVNELKILYAQLGKVPNSIMWVTPYV
ncbi:hypothetical protein AX774_g6134 [Zancudomyces culisetae]|uniref:Uncharacterized protein n=1 Tax=Zancudomyces culisetae TaxID=1213189 RepID=A0A1R1PHG1_ZANCU|nr:hypothetical protein AX774_g6134 [Zancudomyces culisetae]|eukprot:OMH80435.1 hypothetical protein AX774_g6134 [Zancudomyces culisetae]